MAILHKQKAVGENFYFYFFKREKIALVAIIYNLTGNVQISNVSINHRAAGTDFAIVTIPHVIAMKDLVDLIAQLIFKVRNNMFI